MAKTALLLFKLAAGFAILRNKPAFVKLKADLYMTCRLFKSTTSLIYVHLHLEEIPACNQVIIKAVSHSRTDGFTKSN